VHLRSKNTKTNTGRFSVWCSFHFDSSKRSNSKRKKVETLFMTIWAVFYRPMPLILKKSSIAYSDLLKELNWKYFEKEVFDTFCWAWIQENCLHDNWWWIALIIDVSETGTALPADLLPILDLCLAVKYLMRDAIALATWIVNIHFPTVPL